MNRKFLVSVSAFLSSAILWNACAKIDATTVGAGLIPEVDNVHTFEVILPVEIDNHFLADSTRITAASKNAIGILEDPVFGNTEAAMYFSLNPTSYGFYPFGNRDNVVLDSAVLSISYTTVYGDTLLPQTFEVYPISNTTGNFKTDSIFYIADQIDTDPTVIGSRIFLPTMLKDSVMHIENGSDTVYSTNVLRIPMNLSWANQFLAYDTATQFKSDSLFKTHFKGVVVKLAASSANKKAISYWDLSNSTNTKLTFYYKSTTIQNDNPVIDTASYSMIYNYSSGFSQGTQANLITRVPGGDYLSYINNGTTNDDLGFIQTSPGSYISVNIKGLDTFQTTNRIINRAELIFEELPSAESNTFLSPNILFIDAISKTGDSVFTIRRDFVTSTSSILGYEIASLEGIHKNNAYRFNLSRFMQSVVTNKLPYYTFRVYNPYATYPYYESPTGAFGPLASYLFINDYIGAGRVVVGGGSHTTKPAKFRIIYTKL
ncbi:DUF4270 family protein [Gynurincola endophyticus]|uniref:DUF4270 family protein n=1 Tax=Gynurincola endophyticus TaxID=2479004 RepID=UPI00131567E6|nr:DUF4270 family protein [Gynurincola endophyticus]